MKKRLILTLSLIVTICLICFATDDVFGGKKYKYTLTFKEARVIETGLRSTGNQWGIAVKNKSKSTMLMYKKQNNSNPITINKSIQTNYDGCYIGLREYEKFPHPFRTDDRFRKIYSHLNEGDNVIYCIIRDYQMGSNKYWSKWKFIINRTKN
jgi:hypothetical protein